MVSHGHVHVNDRKINISNFQVKEGDVVRFKVDPEQAKRLREVKETTKDQALVEWLSIDDKELTATVKRLPERTDIQLPIQEQLIVELYSK